jgi:hypothetical protein
MNKGLASLVFVLAGLLFSFSQPIANAAETGKPRDFRAEMAGGVWHASPVLGSGWAERLALFDNETFIYAASQMDGETRLRFVSGEWAISANGQLTLHCREALQWQGGKVVPATGSTGSKTELVNPVTVRAAYTPVLTLRIPIGAYVHDDSYPRPWKLFLPGSGALWRDEGWWWKYQSQMDEDDLRDAYRDTKAEAK